MVVYRRDLRRLPVSFKHMQLRHGQVTIVRDNRSLQMEQPLIARRRFPFRPLAKARPAWSDESWLYLQGTITKVNNSFIHELVHTTLSIQ